MRNQRTLHLLLAAIAFLLGANLFVNVHQDRAVRADGIPDSGAQMQAQINQLTELNQKVDRLESLLESGKLGVIVKEMPEPKKQ